MRPMFAQGFRRIVVALVALAAALIALPGPATAMEREALLGALLGGGYVVYFRHAETDWSQRDRIDSQASLASCDAARMRQLSDQGRATARAVGAAMRRLGIPVSAVYASEYCRCVETADLLDVGPVETTRDILNMRAAQYAGGHAALAAAARMRLSTSPPLGSNVVLVAHGNVFMAVANTRPPEGGAAIVSPTGEGRFEVVGMLSARDWIAAAGE